MIYSIFEDLWSMSLTSILFVGSVLMMFASLLSIAVGYKRKSVKLLDKLLFYGGFLFFGFSMIWIDTFVDEVFLFKKSNVSNFKVLQGLLVIASIMAGIKIRKTYCDL